MHTSTHTRPEFSSLECGTTPHSLFLELCHKTRNGVNTGHHTVVAGSSSW
ncbi:hypothetical protein PAHAL_3G150500 [Panicum hallii]|uniref:Uncharacterized protein n=1 Tax=Panicum hallii TaxID=206008 RepID=A0A2T8KIA0_9POAL|nr:hypothetical protein PAHAL_3G150500 [Panicum hallii]